MVLALKGPDMIAQGKAKRASRAWPSPWVLDPKRREALKGRDTCIHLGDRIMAQSLSNVLLHIVFSTKNRYPWLDVTIEEELFKYLAGACRNLGCPSHRTSISPFQGSTHTTDDPFPGLRRACALGYHILALSGPSRVRLFECYRQLTTTGAVLLEIS
jgi:hypothetical protein